LLDLSRDLGDEPVAVAVGRNVLWRGPLHDVVKEAFTTRGLVELVVPAAEGVRAYQKARRFATLLSSPPLPELVRHHRHELPADWLLASATVVVPIVVGLAWIVLLRRFDRGQPEPWWLVLATFALGALSQLVAGHVEVGIWRATPYL